jgi:hypothetical protein
MNWEAIGAIGEIIGAIGVIFTLGYLAYQIRQNTAQLEQNERTAIAAAVSVSATNYRENRRHIYTNRDVAATVLQGMSDPDNLDEVDQYRFRFIAQNTMDALWDLYSQTVITNFSPETWSTQGVGLVKRVFMTNGGSWFWKNHRDEYAEQFRNEIDEILGPSAESPERHQFFWSPHVAARRLLNVCNAIDRNTSASRPSAKLR